MTFPDDVSRFLGEPHFLTLSTFRKDGTIQMSIVWFEYDGELFRVSVTTERAKYKNVRRNKNVSFLIPDKDNNYKYVQVGGEVVGIDTDKDFAFIDSESKRYLGKDRYPYDLERKDHRIVVSIKPRDFASVGFGSSRG